MGAHRKYSTRRLHHRKWTVTLCCLFVLCSSINGTVVLSERLRHQHLKQDDDDVYVTQLEQQQPRKFTVTSACPNCMRNENATPKADVDSLRLEAIKRQILSKLGLRQKPNVTHSLPKEFIMQTLYRTEGNKEGFRNATGDDGASRSAAFDAVDVDDFYGRTSEIISFAEEGFSVNGNSLLEFRVSPDLIQAGQELRVRSATLWIKADIRRSRTKKCKSTEIYVFNYITSIHRPVRLSSEEFSERTTAPIVLTLDDTKPGWQKVDLTETVKRWLVTTRRDGGGLRLFIDCTCCRNWNVHLFNTESDRRTSTNRPFLVVYTDPNQAKRVRRRALDCSSKLGNQCCKERFFVNFTRLGWDDWIIAPSGYYANYCRGDCGHHRTPDTFVTYHTHVIDESRKTQHLSGLQPCCAPLKFSGISLIYMDPGNSAVIKRDMPKMVVDECGCP